MFERFKLTGEVKKAIERATAVLEERARIRQAIARAEATVPAAEAALQEAREALCTAEADAALSAESKSTGAARRACAEARDQLEATTARINGLQRRLAETDDAVLATEDELAVARSGFVRRILDDYRQDYLKAAERFAEVLRVGRGLKEGLDWPLRVDLKLIDPEHPDKVLVPLFELKRQPHAGWLEQWIEDPTARSAYESVLGPKNAAETLSRETKEIRTRRKNAAAEEAKRRLDAEPRPLSLVREYPPEPPTPEADVPNREIAGSPSPYGQVGHFYYRPECTEEKAREKIKAMFGVDISDQDLLGQILKTAKDAYGGELDVAISIHSRRIKELAQGGTDSARDVTTPSQSPSE